MTELSLKAIVSAFSAAGLYILLQWCFTNRAPAEDKHSPASWIPLSDLISGRRLQMLTIAFCLPPTVLFFIIAVQASPLVQALKELTTTYITSVLNAQYKESIDAALHAIPGWLDPAFILVATGLLFAPKARKLLDLSGDLVQALFGINSYVDNVAREAAGAVIESRGEEHVNARLNEIFAGQSIPSPQLGNEDQLAFQLLYLAKDDIKKLGLRAALMKVLNKIGVAWDQSQAPIPQLKYTYLGALSVLYLVLCFIYVIFVPLADILWKSHPGVAAILGPLEWPQPEYRWQLAESIVGKIFSFLVPLVVGIYLYKIRRSIHQIETPIQSWAVIAAGQFIFSFLVSAALQFITVVQSKAGAYTGIMLHFDDFRLWADLFTSALTPVLVMIVWMQCRTREVRAAVAITIICLASALSFSLCQFAYECAALDFRGYYWHQMILGLYITVCYYLVLPIVPKDPTAPAEMGALSPVVI